jgi:uncharacterized protein
MGQSAAVRLGPEVLEATPEGGGHLIGSRCEDCGAHYFPQRRACSRCLSESLERVALSGHGEIYTYTVVHQSTPAFAVPYILAYVDLPEQVRVAGQVVGFEADEIELGAAVELDVLPDGPTFRFRPAVVPST